MISKPLQAVPLPSPTRGRGAITNPTGRFEPHSRSSFDDGWDRDPEQDSAPRSIATTVAVEKIRSIISKNDSPDIPFSQSVNAYRGCEHGCAYCFARPSHSYIGLSPGIDFETKLVAKPDAAAVLRKELGKPSYHCSVIALGTNTDPYQPIESTHRITRSILQVLDECNHPVTVTTKNFGVTADVDLLARMAQRKLAAVFISLTTLDQKLAGQLEPRASRPARRLAAIRTLTAAGVPVGVLTSPMIPGLNDHELEQLIDAAVDAGAIYAGYTLLRLPHDVKDIFEQWLREHTPDRAEHVLQLIRSCYQGKLYDSRVGLRGVGSGPYAKAIADRHQLACLRHGLSHARLALDEASFVAPRPAPIVTTQLSLF